MNADGSRNRFLIDGSNARWSPDGERIAFTAPGEPRGSQIFVRWMDAEGAVTQITHVDKGPGSIKWSPDGNHIGFTMLVDEKQSWSIDMPDRPEGADWTAAPKIVTRLAYRRDRQGFTDTGYRHIFVVPSSGGTPRQITRGSYNHSSVEWTPDGRSILFSGLREDEAEYQWRERSHLLGGRCDPRSAPGDRSSWSRFRTSRFARRQSDCLCRVRLDRGYFRRTEALRRRARRAERPARLRQLGSVPIEHHMECLE